MSNNKLIEDRIEQLCNELREVTSSQTAGFCKEWKLRSIIVSCMGIPAIAGEYNRAYKYVDNSLRMEGFNDDGIENVTAFIVSKHSDFAELKEMKYDK